MRLITKERALRAARMYRGNRSGAAEFLGIRAASYSRLCDRHGIDWRTGREIENNKNLSR